ncbi:PREDICTED: protein LONGIFOLIA 1-like [Populus euphratica]|uniref:Protein LONGIFOLIA 1-like n=1 Tax=Populus euphratica TaxID=75702 RepID=A0AAJ6X723_POPEU|nr:PREDICTED: protein LONGIFOLIA 1-like [Populus euphratica]XP_011007773.1 PREDICTED: protein LONGIFOLIA 1-like [Populus euphratica]XP_011007774.1 PREDICTED: protein LONGIFOLIA 1-like [Populus euphratica]
MAAKLLHSLADDNPDLQKQIGCMTGVFQIFDRHQVLTGRRLNQKRLPPGDSHFKSGSSANECFNAYNQNTTVDIDLHKNLNEKQRISAESSRASFSSSCSSSMSSSLDCNKTAQPEASSFDRIIYPETPSRNPVITQPSTSAHLGRHSLDLRDVVKDSMYREARGLSVKTTAKEEARSHIVKHKDSPRALQASKSADGSYRVGNKGKKNASPVDLKESLKVLAKLHEAPWYYNETKECPRSSYEAKDGSWHTIPNDAPRFSCDGWGINHLSFESRDTIKSTPKLKELPRLSLDSRVISVSESNIDSRSNYVSKDLGGSSNSNEKIFTLQQSQKTQKRPPSVVAKLMGLEGLPDSAFNSHSQPGFIKNSLVEHDDSFSRSLKTNDPNRPIHILKSQRNLVKDPISPRWKNSDLVMKPISRLPIEPAPWKQLDGSRSLKQPFKPEKVPGKTPNLFPSVYSEIEKRLKDLEFKQSGKDLRALKQILEAMQAKGFLENRKEEQASNSVPLRDHETKCCGPSQKPRLLGQQNQQKNHAGVPTTRGSDSLRTCESPIVIIKTAKLVEKSGIPASSVIPIDDLSSLHRIPTGGHADSKKGSNNSRTAKDQSPRNSQRDSLASSSDKRTVVKKNTKSTQSLIRSQEVPKESNPSSARSSGSVSPRLSQKKLELEKRSRPPTPPSDTSKPNTQSNRQPTEKGSPGRKHRVKYPKVPLSDDQLSQISNESRTSSHQGDDTSLQSDDTTFDLKTDMEVMSTERSTDNYSGQSPTLNAARSLVSASLQKKSTLMFEEDGTSAELAFVAPEHPSPVSVLDASVYRDDALSPVKQMPNTIKGDVPKDFHYQQSEDQWNPADNLLSNSVASGLSSDINRKKLQKIENLVQKLRQLNSTHDESSTDYIASLCENTNPDHRYISEILLASGLLLRDLSSGLSTFQLHPSGHPINPELFFVLEQTKASNKVSNEECSPGKSFHSKPNPEKFHRKLIFDAVNEILVKKLALVEPSPEPWLKSDKLAKKTLSAQKLLKELCSEMEHLLVKKSECSLEEDGLKSILCYDVMHRSESWIDFHSETSGVVLDVERLVFKDLVDEIVIGEAAGRRTKPGRSRRQLFGK